MPLARSTCATFALAGALLGCSDKTSRTPSLDRVLAQAGRPSLTAFRSERELQAFFGEVAAAARELRRRAEAQADGVSAAAEPAAEGKAGSAAGAESITNTQHAGVDEGGIVKVHGDHLVILRRGRLFTVRVGDDSLTPVAHADAFGPGIDPAGAWYDEMLIAGDTAIVIGYSYQRGGTEVGLFDLGRGGTIAHRATYHLRSNDYFSSRNYASRIVDGKLVFYAPMYLGLWDDDPARTLPAMRRWHAGASEREFHRIVQPTKIYRPLEGFSAEAMHTVTVCDLAARDMSCTATGVMGPAGRAFYVSDGAVYVWATSWSQQASRSMVVRMPLDGSAPSAIKARGGPIDQFSFLEQDGHLNVLVRGEAAGDAMWAPETTAGDVAMLRVPVAMFSDAAIDVPSKHYARLPRPDGHTVQNRFVGDHLLYGAGTGWGHAEDRANGSKLFVYPLRGGAAATLKLPHGVDRIEALGRDAIVVGGDGAALHFTAVALDRQPAALSTGGGPVIAGRYVRRGASQGELRSHGFFYKPDAGGRGGMLGLPVRSAQQPGASHLVEGSASITFVRNDALELTAQGELEAGGNVALSDECRASCVDWYGNARPIFLRGRILALMGYELVEGSLTGDGIAERRRISFAPTAIGSRR